MGIGLLEINEINEINKEKEKYKEKEIKWKII